MIYLRIGDGLSKRIDGKLLKIRLDLIEDLNDICPSPYSHILII